MTQDELYKSKNKDYFVASLEAMKRAASDARKLAIQTNTAIIMVKDKKIVRITADMLREEERKS